MLICWKLERVREDGTLIEEANEVEFVTHKGNIKTAVSKSNLAMSFFRLDPSYVQKLYDKTSKLLPLSQNQHDADNILKSVSKQSVCIILHYLVKCPRWNKRLYWDFLSKLISVHPRINIHPGNLAKFQLAFAIDFPQISWFLDNCLNERDREGWGRIHQICLT